MVEKTKELISVDNVSLDYGGKDGNGPAIKDVSLDIYPGEFVCVMGPSGCGKSTLLKILAGFIKPTGGTASLDGNEINGIDAQRGVVFQNSTLYEWYSVKKNVGFGLSMRHVAKATIAEEVEKYLAEVKLDGWGDKKVFELSGGMKQRAAIASALINKPEILLMDEPFGALDALTKNQMQNLIRRIWAKSHNTIFFITHDVDEALLLGSRVVVMSKHPGRIIADFPAPFTTDILRDNDDDIRYSKDFLAKRKKILEMISQDILE